MISSWGIEKASYQLMSTQKIDLVELPDFRYESQDDASLGCVSWKKGKKCVLETYDEDDKINAHTTNIYIFVRQQPPT